MQPLWQGNIMSIGYNFNVIIRVLYEQQKFWPWNF